jgi:hypothetical protein
MVKKLVLTVAAGLALGATGAFADNNYVFDDPYWKQQLDRSGGASLFAQFAAGLRNTMTDASGEARAADAGYAAAIEAEKARLDAAGFPQYAN